MLVLKDGTRFVLPKQYSIVLTDTQGKTIGDKIAMEANSETVIRYIASGNNPSLALLTQGDISAAPSKLENGDPCFVVKTPYGFSGEQTKLMAVFTFPDASPVTVVKTITVTKK